MPNNEKKRKGDEDKDNDLSFQGNSTASSKRNANCSGIIINEDELSISNASFDNCLQEKSKQETYLLSANSSLAISNANSSSTSS